MNHQAPIFPTWTMPSGRCQNLLELEMNPVPMDFHEKMRLRAATFRVTRLYPGPVGELLSRELLTWEEFGYRLGDGRLVMRLVDHVLTTPLAQSDSAKSRLSTGNSHAGPGGYAPGSAQRWMSRPSSAAEGQRPLHPSPDLDQEGRLMDNPLTQSVGRSVEPMAVTDTQSQMTLEQAGRLAVIAVAADLECWARTASVDGNVGLNDLTRTLDLIRGA